MTGGEIAGGLSRALKQTLCKQVTHGLHHRIWRLAGQEMAGDWNHTPLVARGEVAGMVFRLFWWSNTIAGTVQNDRRHRDWRLFSKSPLEVKRPNVEL